jgi:hypothetical protein
VLVPADNGAVDDGVFVVRISGGMHEDLLQHPARGPTAEPPVRVLPVAKPLRQIAPRNAGTIAIEHRFNESAVVLSVDADMRDPRGRRILEARLCFISYGLKRTARASSPRPGYLRLGPR